MHKCKRCGFPVHPDDKAFAHRNCDETWVDGISELPDQMQRINKNVEEMLAKIAAKVTEETKDWPEQDNLGKTSRSRT